MYYVEKERKLEVNDSYEVIVVGSGPAGIGAAVAAGRMGAKVLLVEATNAVGGIATTGMMSHFTGSCGSKIYWEILNRQAEKNFFPTESLVSIDPEMLKNTYYEMLEEAGVDVLLYTIVCDAIMEGDKLVGIITQNKCARMAYMAKVVVDASGDGDVAYHAGAAFTLGREADHKMQPATLMFKVGGVDMENAIFPSSFEHTIEVPKGEIQALAREHLPAPAGHCLLYKSTIPGIVTVNMTNIIGVDGTKAEDLTRAELECRKQIEPIVAFLREFAPGYENCYVIGAASLIGIRETRHFHGVKTINENDIYEARQFEDAVVYDAFFNFDVHNITGSGLDKTGSQREFKQTKGYTIPYGCLVPEKIDGLVLSGRNISGTHIAHSNFRAMPICVGIGVAGGIAAALAAKRGCEVRELTAADIQPHL
ncbi:MAG: FAD-dependent oxidoreductase [Clostridia bacterium]|nr:FAD-dependent oxidoreductase [Clostridia bacterium]